MEDLPAILETIPGLNAFVTEHHTVIRQIIGENKESEITMLPELIDSEVGSLA